ncbi:MAG TPA: glycosyltransferase family 2 protein [Flavitalea sp.]|nr:glycosyltransferase family 2 protein [Flavitalea sp.]
MLSIIIVTYNVSDHLQYCLLSVYQSARNLDVEIIVIDNASVDNTIPVLKQQFPDVITIQNPSNDGFARACNQGAAIAKGETLLFLNPDTIIGESTLEYVMNHLNNHSKVGAAGVMMIDGTGRFLPESKRGIPDSWNSFCKILGLTSLFPNSYLFSGYHAGHLSKEKEHSVPVLSGAFMMVKTRAFREAGGFDERFFMYGEDIDLSMLLVKQGYINLYLPLSPILHFKGRSSTKDRKYVHRFYKAMLQFIDKYYPNVSQLPLRMMLKLSVLGKRSLALYQVSSGKKKVSRAPTTRVFQYLYGDPSSCREYQAEEKSSLIQIVKDPVHAHKTVLCQGEEFPFESVIAYIRDNPNGQYGVHVMGVKGLID